MSESPYNIKTIYYKRGQQVCAVSTGAKQKTIRPQRNHKRFRGGWDLTKFYTDHER